MPRTITGDQLTLVHVLVWCRQAKIFPWYYSYRVNKDLDNSDLYNGNMEWEQKGEFRIGQTASQFGERTPLPRTDPYALVS